MNPLTTFRNLPAAIRKQWETRRGAFLVLAAFSLVGVVTFVALSVDLGVISLTRAQLQNAADAAALAAAQEITAAIESAGENAEQTGDVNSIAVEAAKTMAVKVAAMNGFYIDPDADVCFGRRTFNPDLGDEGEFEIIWAEPPFSDTGSYNVVRVTIRRDNPDFSQPDKQLQLFFANVFGDEAVSLRANAIAFVEARDLMLVLDYSRSMNYDTQFKGIHHLGQTAVEDNLRDCWEDLGSPTYGSLTFEPQYPHYVGQPGGGPVAHVEVTWKGTEIDIVSTKGLSNVVMEFEDGSTQKYEYSGAETDTDTMAGWGSHAGKKIEHAWIKSGQNSSGDCPGCGEHFDFSDSGIEEAFGLDNVNYPYASGSWTHFISKNQDDDDVEDAGYQYKFGGMNLIHYWLHVKTRHHQTADLWKTRHYPFHAMKNGVSLLLDFLDDLEFGDHSGIVIYDSAARTESALYMPSEGIDIDLGDDLITDDFDALDTIQRHKQAGHYDIYTGLGYGIEEARSTLSTHLRYGARPTILVMTDGNANRSPNDFSLPGDWDWAEWTDYDGDGDADYTTNNRHRQYAFYQLKLAVDEGATIHTMSVGAGADRNLMRAMAFAGGGEWIDVPGGTTIAEMEDQMLAAFKRIAANVPPAKILNDPSELGN